MDNAKSETQPPVFGLYRSKRSNGMYRVFATATTLGYVPRQLPEGEESLGLELDDFGFLAIALSNQELYILPRGLLLRNFERVEQPTDVREVRKYMRYLPDIRVPATAFMELLTELRELTEFKQQALGGTQAANQDKGV